MNQPLTSQPNHVVVVYHDQRLNVNPCRIAPAAIAAIRGHTVLFINSTHVTLQFQWPNGSPFGQTPTSLGPNTKQVHQVDSKASFGEYPFEVDCNGTLAVGSRPIIIIYDDKS